MLILYIYLGFRYIFPATVLWIFGCSLFVNMIWENPISFYYEKSNNINNNNINNNSNNNNKNNNKNNNNNNNNKRKWQRGMFLETSFFS